MPWRSKELFVAGAMALAFAGCASEETEFKEFANSSSPAADSDTDDNTSPESSGELTSVTTPETDNNGELMEPVESSGSGDQDATDTAPTDGDRESDTDTVAESTNPLPSVPVREIKLLVPERDFSVEGPNSALRVSYDDLDLLKVLNMEPVPVDAVKHMPDWLKGLDGKRIRIRGFMFPPFQDTGIQAFVLARDNQICCFGRNPKIYDVFEVILREGVTTDYIQNRPFDVVGTFHIVGEADEGELIRLYEITDAVVIEK